MKNALIVLAVVALVVLTLGLFNREASVDVDYVVGVWRSVNVFWLFAIAAGVVVAAGLLGASLARARGWRERGKLEKELLEVYRRLRAVEAQLEQVAGAAGVAAAVVEAQTVAAATPAAEAVEAVTQAGRAGEGATAVTTPAETPTAVTEAAEARTAVSEAAVEPTAVSEAAEEPTAVTGAAEAVTEQRPAGAGADEAPTAVSEVPEALTDERPGAEGPDETGA
ncbi:MAG TPA: hypothetical protein VLA35_09960 [Thermoleophilia bacterium]|nr:hypothetical protein [Thermoleophilia bacterium]